MDHSASGPDEWLRRNNAILGTSEEADEGEWNGLVVNSFRLGREVGDQL